MINVVNYKMVGCVDYFTVHSDIGCLFRGTYTTGGIESVSLPDSMPFVLIQSLETLRIDDGVFALFQRYPAESIAVAEPAVK